MLRTVSVLCLAALLFLAACDGQNRHYAYPDTPVGDVPVSENNRATVYGVELGRKLFFDPLLSANARISCGTCHHPRKAFSDGVALSHVGVSNERLLRHAPALFNLAWMEGTFWDGGAKNLESQVLGPLLHPDEMAADPEEIVKRLREHPTYPRLFKKAWGTDSITSSLIARSLAQYERTLLSFNSKYDKWKRGETQLEPIELKGYKLYQSHCRTCHVEGLFTDNAYHNNGLDQDSVFQNDEYEQIYKGRYRITLDSADLGKYKTPSLRNLGYTQPYMHDGRFRQLMDVVKHYSSRIQPSATLDKHLPDSGFRFDQEERTQLIHFLHTLNDTSFVNDH